MVPGEKPATVDDVKPQKGATTRYAASRTSLEMPPRCRLVGHPQGANIIAENFHLTSTVDLSYGNVRVRPARSIHRQPLSL